MTTLQGKTSVPLLANSVLRLQKVKVHHLLSSLDAIGSLIITCPGNGKQTTGKRSDI